MRRFRVDLAEGGYDVLVGKGVRTHLSQVAREARASACVVISDATVAELHAGQLRGQLEDAGWKATLLTFPSGEASKTAATAGGLWDALAELGADRRTLLVACGGGVVGDVVGFVAATFARGLPYVQVPTTLVAMVDSAIGGKTGINLTRGKNLVGAFHQPQAVLADLDYLSSLPDREHQNGWAEIIKCATIADASLFETLVARRDVLLSQSDGDLLEDVIARCAQIKIQVVRADPREEGQRAILNYGHTLGHALEQAVGFGRVPHGRAVAWGMVVAGQLSVRLGRCPAAEVTRQDAALRAYGLLKPLPAPPSWESLARALAQDKKRAQGELRWVLLKAVGRACFGQAVPGDLVRTVAEEALAHAGAGNTRA
jgi:3-dehydroquinate synthase